MYIVLGVLYEAIFIRSRFSTLPSAGVGALFALLLSRSDLGMIGIIGIILLIGIVEKNAIMMVDFALEAERGKARTPSEAINQACLLRFRPILMTTMAALFAALPLMVRSASVPVAGPTRNHDVGGLIVDQAAHAVHEHHHLPRVRPLGAQGGGGPGRSEIRGEAHRRISGNRAAAEQPHGGRPVRAVRQASHRHYAIDSSAWRSPSAIAFRFLPVPSLPQVDYPNHLGVGIAAWREPGKHGGGRSDPAGAGARPHRRRPRNDLLELARLISASPCSST